MQNQLCQLVLLNGFQSNPNTPGVEKLVACSAQTSWLHKPPTQLTSTDLNHPGAASPGQVFLVKGYNRSLCALGVLYAAFDKPELLQEGFPHHYKTTWRVNIRNSEMSNSIWFIFVPGRSCPIQCGSALTQFDSDLIGLMFNHSSWLRFDWIDVQTFCDIEHVDTNNEPRSFKVVYATAVRSDSSYIVNTNRGHLAEIRCTMMQQFLENCSMNMCVLGSLPSKFEQHLSHVLC